MKITLAVAYNATLMDNSSQLIPGLKRIRSVGTTSTSPRNDWDALNPFIHCIVSVLLENI